ncbi:MAG: MtrB/PioB family outer membrane beta-barrel protein, partial [Thermoanaerobaculia bacterium]
MIILSLVLFFSLGVAYGQTAQPPAQTTATMPGGLTGEIVIAPQVADVDTDSAKFSEYRDLQDGVFLPRLRLDVGSLQLRASRVGRDDQQFEILFGNAATFRGTLSWNQIPHRLSTNAFSPYTYAGDGLYTVPAVVGILTTSADGSKYLPSDAAVNDQKIADYLGTYLRQLPEIGTQRRRGSIGLAYQPLASTEIAFTYTQESKKGDRVSFGTFGDRPPRTLNVEMPEPVDYEQRDLRVQAGYAAPRYQILFEFAAPEFRNDLQGVRWQSMYFGPDADGSTLYNNDVILAGDAIVRRSISLVGQRALPPDNRYPNATVTFGLNTPMKGRLTATASAGRMEQDVTLLPYSYSTLTTDWNLTSKLPRATGDAKIDTRLLNLSYSFVPVRNLNVRAYARAYDLENDTPTDRWLYPTQDTAGTTGSVPYKSKRLNLGYGYGKQNAGVETTLRLGKSSVGLELEHENLNRDFREADTSENTIRARFASTPLPWLAIRARAGFGKRDGGTYDFKSNSASYWYEASEVNDGDNPRFAFVNDPDLRRFDVSDRDRKLANLVATITPAETLSFSLTYNWRDDDFDSGVQSIQPFAGTAFRGADSRSVGVQTGLLTNMSRVIALDATWAPEARWSLNAFVTRERLSFDESGSGFDDAEKTNNQEDLIGKPGKSWSDPANRWFATTDDETTTFGIGGRIDFVPDRLMLNGDLAYSLGTVNIDYSGYGASEPLTTTYYAFRSPDEASNRQRTANLGLEYKMSQKLTF